MFEDSDLLQHDVLVLRATAPPDAQFSVLDETGREIGRVAAEGGLVRKKPARLVLYDQQHTPLLVAEHFEKHGETAARYLDGQGQPIDIGVLRLKQQGSFFRKRPGYTFTEAREAEVGSFAIALPPEGDYRLGATFLLTFTAELTCELRLAALGLTIDLVYDMSRRPSWMLKGAPKVGQAWPGSAPAALTR